MTNKQEICQLLTKPFLTRQLSYKRLCTRYNPERCCLFQIPDVVNLNVGGTHTYVTLRSTLARVSGSSLADMFSYNGSACKDTNGRYFLDVDGPSFSIILDYLKYDILPKMPLSGSFGGGGGGLFGGLQPTSTFGNQEIVRVCRSARLLGLKELADHFEQFFPVLARNKIKVYEKSVAGYDDCVKAIQESISAEALLLRDQYLVRIRQEGEDDGSKCCVHECQPTGGFNKHDVINVEVEVPFEVDSTALASLCYYFMRRGYNVSGQEAFCHHFCNKEEHNRGGFVFGGGARNCCQRRLHLLHFTWSLNTRYTPVNTPRFGFGQPKSAFGGASQEPQNVFGQPAGDQGCFGGGNNQGGRTFFGSAPAAGNQTAGGLFGSPTNNTDRSSGGGLFGSANTETHTSGFSFGSATPTQVQKMSNIPAQATSFGSTAPATGFGGFGSTAPATGFGSTAQATGFGSTAPMGFVQQSANKQTLFGQASTQSLFGKSPGTSPFKLGVQNTSGFETPSFGNISAPAPSGLFGQMKISDKPKEANSPKGFSFAGETKSPDKKGPPTESLK